MTDQEITEAREDLQQFDIEQLRVGVMLQLLKIESLTKERDALAASHKECVRCLGEALQDRTDVAIERDFLAIANKDLSEAMVRYQQLQDAAKLALDALDEATSYTSCSTWSPSMTRDCQSAITALRRVGVQ